MSKEPKEDDKSEAKKSDPPICGIAMPISGFDGYPREHWADVKLILEEAIQDADCSPLLVSNDNEMGVIQQRIVTNLYHNPLVICDVSGKNPNVMFELGMRLAFDRPVIIVKDDATDYSFDTSPLEHLPYRKDLRMLDTRDFQRILTGKIKSAISGKNQMSFLKSFGNLIAKKLEDRDVSKEDFIIESLELMRKQIARLHQKGDGVSRMDTPRPIMFGGEFSSPILGEVDLQDPTKVISYTETALRAVNRLKDHPERADDILRGLSQVTIREIVKLLRFRGENKLADMIE
jgi:hypothetical protein